MLRQLLSRARAPAARDVLLSPPERVDQEDYERRFFSSVRLSNGTLKLTAAGRLDDVNAMIAPHLSRGKPLQAMDIGVSSGITTLEWLADLERAGLQVHMVATDLTAHALLWSLGGVAHVFTEESGYPLQYEAFGLVFRHPARRHEKLLFFMPATLAATLFRGAARRQSHRSSRRGLVSCRRVAFVSPRLMRASLELIDDNVLLPWADARKFDVVRVSNVLNPAYFTAAQLRLALASLRARVAPGGLMILSRTHGREDADGNHATLFRADRRGEFTVVDRLRGGSELEHLLLESG